MCLFWFWRAWSAWWLPHPDGPKEATNNVLTTEHTDNDPELCPACGRPIADPTIPDGYTRPHCLSCAQAIDRRTIARQNGKATHV